MISSQAGRYADRLAGLACYREQAHLATSRRIKVDALAGDFTAAAERGEQFLVAWKRAGRPVARTLNVTCYAVAMVHGVLGDDRRRDQWTDITRTLSGDPARLTGCGTGWAPTFDALVALERGQPDAAWERLTADVDDRAVWGSLERRSVANVVCSALGRGCRPHGSSGGGGPPAARCDGGARESDRNRDHSAGRRLGAS